MADFSLTTVFVAPITQTTLPVLDSTTQALLPGILGVFSNAYKAVTLANSAAAPYLYIAQGRTNTYLQGSKRSDKIKGCATANCNSNVTEWYKVVGCPTPVTQITDVVNWTVQCGDVVTVTLRAHSSYLDTLYFNGWTRSVTVPAPCCNCGVDPCTNTDVPALIDRIIAKFAEQGPGNNPDNITFSDFYSFQRIGTGPTASLRISGKPLTKYGQPCDVAAFPYEYDRMWFRTFVYEGPATTADFIVADSCNHVADAVVVQRANYAKGTGDEIAQLEKNFYSYQAGYLKHLYRMGGYNENFESWVNNASNYDTYFIKFNEYNRSEYQWGDYIPEDSTVIIAVQSAATNGLLGPLLEGVLNPALGTVASDSGVCITTTSTTTIAGTTTTTSSTLIP